MVSHAKRLGTDITGRSVQYAGSVTPASVSSTKDPAAPSPRTKLFVALCYATCCIIWGTTWYAMRICVQPNIGYAPNFAAAFRFVVAIVLFIPIWMAFCRRERRPTKAEVAWLSLAGLFNGMYQSFIYTSELSISGGLAAVVCATSPIMVALIASSTGVEKVSRASLLGFCACFVGIALVCYDRLQVSSAQGLAIVFVVIAAVFNSCANVTLKGKSTGLHPVMSATIFLAASDVPVWLASWLHGEKWSIWPIAFAPMAATIYMALASSILAFTLYLYMIKHISLMTVSTMPFVLPILALIVDMFVEKTVTLTPQAWMGIVVVLGGLIFSIVQRHRQ